MSDTDDPKPDSELESTRKRSRRPMLLALILALAGGGAGFFATYSGMLSGGEHSDQAHSGDHGESPPAGAMPDIAFVALDPMVISLGDGASARHLRFRAQLEVPAVYHNDVERLLPRVVDVLNSYLRAVELTDIANAAALIRLRAQMLRRIQIVTGAGRVNDLLIMEFVVN